MSDREIARQCGVGYSLVSDVRTAICPNRADTPATRTATRNGKTHEQAKTVAGKSGLAMAARIADGDTSPEALQWLREGFTRHLTGRALDHALGLDRASRKREAYRIIGEVAEILGADGCGAWKCAHRVEEAIEHFEGCVWPRLRAGGEVVMTGSVNPLLARLFRCGVRFPREQRQIYELVLKKL